MTGLGLSGKLEIFSNMDEKRRASCISLILQNGIGECTTPAAGKDIASTFFILLLPPSPKKHLRENV